MFLTLCCIVMTACLRPSESHEHLDERVGEAESSTLSVETGGRSAVRSIGSGSVRLWAAAPALEVRLSGMVRAVTLTVDNVLPDAQLWLRGVAIPRSESERPTQGVWQVELDADGLILEIASADAEEPRPHAIGVLSDVQEALTDVGDIFARMNDDELRYVISTGDLSSDGTFDELIGFQDAMQELEVPLYSTVGNHEVPGPDAWNMLFGPFSGFFVQHRVAVSLVDSSNATIDPDLRDRMLRFADATADMPHLFLTHVPILDASGLRAGAFRSRNEAARTLSELAERRVDALFFGHVHSFYAYELAEIPTYISGGGGAIPERLDGIDRHYLRVEMIPSADEPIESVSLVRID